MKHHDHSIYIMLAIVGCRHYQNYDEFESHVNATLRTWAWSPTCIVSGGASGADQLAERYAHEHQLLLKVYPANWSLGRQAGPLRNTKIVQASDRLIAFPSKTSVGTWDTIRKAQQKKMIVHIISI